MSKPDKYRQCSLRKEAPEGFLLDVVYIPEQFAVKGTVLGIKKKDQWDEGWKVIDTYPGTLSIEESQILRSSFRAWQYKLGY